MANKTKLAETLSNLSYISARLDDIKNRMKEMGKALPPECHKAYTVFKAELDKLDVDYLSTYLKFTPVQASGPVASAKEIESALEDATGYKWKSEKPMSTAKEIAEGILLEFGIVVNPKDLVLVGFQRDANSRDELAYAFFAAFPGGIYQDRAGTGRYDAASKLYKNTRELSQSKGSIL